MTRRTLIWIVSIAAVGGASAAAGISTASSIAGAESSLPTTRAVRGPLSLNVNAIGELRASRTVPISAPAVGGQLRVLSIAPSGARVEPGDVIVEFDPVDQLYSLQQAESQLQEAEQEMVRLKANSAVQEAEAKVALLTARFNVRRAELDIRGDAELVAQNLRKKQELTLEEAKRSLAQLERDFDSRALTSAAQLAVQQERYKKERTDAERARQNIESLTVRAEVPGLVVVRQNRDASGGIMFSGMTLPDYKAGDTINAGRPILDVYDISALEVRTRIDEHQRDNVMAGQRATVTFDSIPGLEIGAEVVSVANLATRSQTPGPGRQFDSSLRLDRIDPRLRPGTSTRLVLKGETIPEALYLPRTAIFEKDGKPIVYVRRGDFFEPVPVTIAYRTETHTAVEGIPEGTEVSLVNPDRSATQTSATNPMPDSGTIGAPGGRGGGGGGGRGGRGGDR
ncbi:MAG: HlyD family efflux transporter periplasmic adaptor subunit [Vicinamibacterales bacterium]